MAEFPKSKRVVDSKAIDEIRSFGFCMLQDKSCSGGLDVHHIKSRGSGGDDVLENLILVCRHHHNMIHNGLISKEDLLERRLG